VTSFHHQPEAQHPKSSAIHKLPADYPIFRGASAIDVEPVEAPTIWRSQACKSVTTTGFDIAKSVFQVHGVVPVERRLSKEAQHAVGTPAIELYWTVVQCSARLDSCYFSLG